MSNQRNEHGVSDSLGVAEFLRAPGDSALREIIPGLAGCTLLGTDWLLGSMAKGRAEEQSQHRTDAAARRPHKSVSSSLLALGQKAEAEPDYRFFDLYGMINEPMLVDCFYDLRRLAAPGLDGMTVSEYEKELGPRVAELVGRLKAKRYRAQLVKRQYIDKGGGKLRPLGLPTLEDKLVQMAARRVLEAIYEKDFLDCNNGYRPGRSARETTQKLQDRLFRGRIRWMVEADIEGFFEHIDHDWLIQMIEQRVNDSVFVQLIRKWREAGVMEETGTVLHPASGTPQGGVISPVLSHIYLHCVLDLWTEKNYWQKRSWPDGLRAFC